MSPMEPVATHRVVNPARRRVSRRSKLTAAAIALATAASGAAFALATQSPSAAAALPNNFKNVGYMPSWQGDVNRIQYNKLTHINYAFIRPTAAGGLTAVDNPEKLRNLVSLAHRSDVKVSIAVGGWSDFKNDDFEGMARSEATRTAFVNNLNQLIEQFDLDGVDMDWEYPMGASAGDFTKLMQQLSTSLHSKGKLLTAAVVSGGEYAQGIQPPVFQAVDFLNIMTYDGGTPHANYQWAVDSVNEWIGRGLPKAKAVMGVPFYSRPAFKTFAELVAMDPANANRDCTTVNGSQECYNSVATVRRKTKFMLANGGGMMNWELSQDATGANSLVSAMFEAATADGPGPEPSSTASPSPSSSASPSPTPSPTPTPTPTQPSAGRGPITGIAGKCVEVKGGSKANGAAVHLATCNRTARQRWTLSGDGTLRALGKCAEVTGGSKADGAKVQMFKCNRKAQQQWRPQSDGTVVNAVSRKCLDATDRRSTNGTRLQVWACHGDRNQVFKLPS
jgi:chitinase